MNQLFEAAFHSAPTGIALMGLDGKWIQVNRAVCQIVGYSETELLALTFQQITHPDDLAADMARVGQLLRGEIAQYELEKRYFHKDGRIVWIHLGATLARDPRGEPVNFIAHIQDITARRRAEKANETLFLLPVALHFVSTFDGYFERLSPSWANLLGYSIEHLLSVPYLSLIHPDDRQRTLEEAGRHTAGESSILFENRYLHADGSVRWILWNCSTIVEERLTYGVALDYTARKEAALTLQRTLEEKDRLLAELVAAQKESQSFREGFLTVCAWTNRIKLEGRWVPMDEFLSNHLHFHLTHGISDEGMQNVLAEMAKDHTTPKPPTAP